MQLKICDIHLTCKVGNKYLNVREQVEVVEWNKRWSPPFPCCPVNCQCLKENLIQKKSFQCFTFLKRWIRDIWKWHMSTIKNGKILCQKITVKRINHVDLICHFDFLAMISLFRLSFLLKMARSCYIVILRKL